MRRARLAFALIVAGVAVAGCDFLPKDKEKEALKKRVAELEQAQASPAPAVPPAAEPSPVPSAEPAVQARPSGSAAGERPAVRSTPRAGSTAGRSSRAPSPAPASTGGDAGGPPEAPAAVPAEKPVEASREARAAAPPEPIEIPDGSQLELLMETAISSSTSQVGERVVARIDRAASPDGTLNLPGGAEVTGRVSRAKSAKRLGGQAELAVVFDRIKLRGQTHELLPIYIEDLGSNEAKRDKVAVAGGAVAGAVVGGVAKGGKGAVRGAIIGALGGAGVAAATKGHDVDLPSGSRWIVTVRRSASLE